MYTYDGLKLSISQILTLTGDASNCYANAAETYAKLQWPKTNGVVLKFFDQLLGLIPLNGQGENHGDFTTEALSKVEADKNAATVLIRGTSETIIEIVEQICWLITAIRPPQKSKVSVSDSLFEHVGLSRYRLQLLPLEDFGQGQKTCWTSLFPGSVVARDYPVPYREEGEVGLELPF